MDHKDMNNRLLTSSFLSSSSSSDEEYRPRRQRVFLQRRDPFIEFEDIDFKTRFRLSKTCMKELLRVFGNHLQPLSNRNNIAIDMVDEEPKENPDVAIPLIAHSQDVFQQPQNQHTAVRTAVINTVF
ncbi:hypothetical protein ILUMI_16463 [Ignelater luminosus]|uniref:Uncharacterized protein n=1 Tax=Ignelater luminosus TaxID=2038154 RepID=A0A8K0G2V4_IGNLU|nr:hypothetical protein ILUMI_16463 [Ignelater luminosus]